MYTDIIINTIIIPKNTPNVSIPTSIGDAVLSGMKLWCISSDKKNKRISENDTEIINEILSIVREQYPNAYI